MNLRTPLSKIPAFMVLETILTNNSLPLPTKTKAERHRIVDAFIKLKNKAPDLTAEEFHKLITMKQN